MDYYLAAVLVFHSPQNYICDLPSKWMESDLKNKIENNSQFVVLDLVVGYVEDRIEDTVLNRNEFFEPPSMMLLK